MHTVLQGKLVDAALGSLESVLHTKEGRRRQVGW